MSRLSLALIIAALLGAISILILGVFSGRDDKGFPQGLSGNVPRYQAYRTNDDRDCSAPYPYALYCYHVDTEADDERSLALIVEDIIREDNIEEKQDRMVAIYFYHPGSYYGDPAYASAYAFRSENLAEEYFSKYDEEDATVIDGVYVFGAD
jgi:hypothetical protein